MTKRIHVVAAVIENDNGEIFIAKRPIDKHQGGLWEFPGGKVEPNENALQALTRELHEEIGIHVEHARPLIRISHDYPDKSVLLDVWTVNQFRGHAHGKENQDVRWADKTRLHEFQFPAANQPIISACTLPSQYLITPEPNEDNEIYLANISNAIDQHGIKLIQFRAKNVSSDNYLNLAEKLQRICAQRQCRLLLNTDLEIVQRLNADGMHLNSRLLMSLKTRPIPENKLLGASCHNEEELKQAEAIGADFAVLAPVKHTTTHPAATPMEWQRFETLTQKAAIPVYALGGLQLYDLDQSHTHGAQGIAGISLFKV